MKHFTVYKPNGEILRTGTCADQDLPLQAQPGELVIEGRTNPDRDRIDVATKSVLQNAVPVVEKVDSYSQIRARMYPSIADQLDMLWHSMDANPALRTEPFYSTIKSVKDAVPKDGEFVFNVGAN